VSDIVNAALVVLLAVVVGLLVVVWRAGTGRNRGGGGHDTEQVHASAELEAARAQLDHREQRLTAREARLDEDARELARSARRLVAAEEEIRRIREEADEHYARAHSALERASGLSTQQARAELQALLLQQAKREASRQAAQIEAEAREQALGRARHLVAEAVVRVASTQTAESATVLVSLPQEEMKGRIIGRDGRHIRVFEQLTGVNVLVDEVPAGVVLSCFDPVRREVARQTLEILIADGRIHPQRIEDSYAQAVEAVGERCRRAAAQALVDAGVDEVHPALLDLLGRLHVRTSYGQNVLAHLVETAHLGGLMAAELGVDPRPVRRAAFLHDIGKAVTGEVDGSHAMVGAELARTYGEHEDIVHAIAAHHDEVPPTTVEALLTQAADACSASRPGARHQAAEEYAQRLTRLEEIASGHEGVERVYAMQSGHEVRVMVLPAVVDDLAAQVLARDIAKQVEEELTYPGQVRVTVIRESRAVEIAR
jgi:ribonuclease Y